MIPIIDLHCDTIMALYQNKDKELRCNDLQIDVNKLKDGNYLAQVFAMFVYLKGELNPFKTCDEMIDLFYSELEKNKDLSYEILKEALKHTLHIFIIITKFLTYFLNTFVMLFIIVVYNMFMVFIIFYLYRIRIHVHTITFTA